MGEISSSLIEFKSTIGNKSNIDAMEAECSTIQTKIETVSTSINSLNSNISSYYSSTNKDTILSSVNQLKETYSKINQSIDSKLKKTLSDSRELLTLVEELEKINVDIENQRRIINNNKDDTTQYRSASNRISELNTKFDETHSKALTLYSSIYSKDAVLPTTEDSPVDLSGVNFADIKYGEINLRSFKATNGEELKYYLYVPKKENIRSNNSATLFMHGGDTHQKVEPQDIVKQGLAKLVANHQYEPSQFLILPAVTNFDDKGVQALKELTDDVVKTYNIDQNKVGVAGHSYGGITAYKLINRYPNYFSCCVAISGSEKVTSAFKGVPVWSFNSSQETQAGPTSIHGGKRAIKEVNEAGGKGYLTVLKGNHRNTNEETFSKEYLSPDGEMINPLEWTFKQVKS